jgi:hypothetical protein
LKSGGEIRCVAIQMINMNMHTTTRARSTFTSIFMIPIISTLTSAVIDSGNLRQVF